MAAQMKWDMGMDEVTSPATLKAAFAEMLATTLFIFFGVGAIIVLGAGGGIVGVALANGFAFGLLVASISPISGGHINPAITFAMMITGRISLAKGVIYVIAQLIGACVGAALLRAFILDELVLEVPGAGGHLVNADVVTNLGAVGLEAVGTFLLVWTVFATAVTVRGSGIAAPLYIGLSIAVIQFVLIPLTGAGVNPAATFGPALVNSRWDEHWVYWVGPLIGAATAGITYFILYLSSEEASMEAESA